MIYEYLWHRVTQPGRRHLGGHKAITGEATGILWLAKGLVLPVGLAMVPVVVVGSLALVSTWIS